MLERGLGRRAVGKGVEEWAYPVRETSQHGVRERNRPLEPGPPDELDGLVHGRVARDAVDEGKLVRAEPERGPHGRVEPLDAPATEGLDRVVERPPALHRTEREALREAAIAVLERPGRAAERTVGIGALLEDAQEHLVRRRAGGAYRRSPRSHAS